MAYRPVVYFYIGLDYVDSTDFKDPVQTLIQYTTINPISIGIATKYSSQTVEIDAVDLTLLD